MNIVWFQHSFEYIYIIYIHIYSYLWLLFPLSVYHTFVGNFRVKAFSIFFQLLKNCILNTSMDKYEVRKKMNWLRINLSRLSLHKKNRKIKQCYKWSMMYNKTIAKFTNRNWIYEIHFDIPFANVINCIHFSPLFSSLVRQNVW